MKDPVKVILFVISIVAVMAVGAFFLLKLGATTPAVANTPSGNAQDVQIVRMAVVGYKYEPETITVKAGQPVRWIVDATQATGCAQSLVMRKYGINAVLQGSNNVFEFTPTQTGTVSFSCSMNMVRGQFQVI